MTLQDRLRKLSKNLPRRPEPIVGTAGAAPDILKLSKKLKEERYISRRPEQEQQLSSLKQKLIAGRKDTTPEMAETKRICALPLDYGMTAEEEEYFNYQYLLADAYDRGFRLWTCQANAVKDYMKYGGGFFPMGVGWGKTLTTLMIASYAYKQGLYKILLLVPPSVYKQLILRDIPWARTKVTIALPFHRMGKKSKKHRLELAQSGKPGCYILPYSLLSTADSVDLLEGIKPDVIICDEAHRLKNRTASRTRRFLKYVHVHNPQLICLSGTITSKCIADYQHLIRLCLGSNCPLPRSPIMAGEWGAVIDSGVWAIDDRLAAPLIPLLHWARNNFPGEEFPEITSGFRKAYKKRLNTSPGVVATGDAEIGTSLVLCNRQIDGSKTEGWDILEKLNAQIDELALTPNGDEIEHAIHAYKWKYELSSGFYNELVWPTVEELAKKRNIDAQNAEMLLKKARNHHAASQEYAKELRSFLRDKSQPGYDTPMLVGKNISQYGSKYVGAKLTHLWQRMKSLEFPGMPERISNQIRVCSYKVDAAVKWASCIDKHEGALLWVWNQEMGHWVFEKLKEAGLKTLYASAGSTLFDPNNIEKTQHHIVVTSIPAHHEGKNLQMFQHQLYVQWPRPPKEAEQSLGRTHRNGQKADELLVYTLNTTAFDHTVFAATLNDTLYIQQTTGLRQKLIMASYDPLPKIYSPEWLRERGMQNFILDGETTALMVDRFGDFS